MRSGDGWGGGSDAGEMEMTVLEQFKKKRKALISNPVSVKTLKQKH